LNNNLFSEMTIVGLSYKSVAQYLRDQ